MVRFTEATGIRDGEGKDATSMFRPKYWPQCSRMSHGTPSRLLGLISTVADGELIEKRDNMLMAIARGFNIRLCRVW